MTIGRSIRLFGTIGTLTVIAGFGCGGGSGGGSGGTGGLLGVGGSAMTGGGGGHLDGAAGAGGTVGFDGAVGADGAAGAGGALDGGLPGTGGAVDASATGGTGGTFDANMQEDAATAIDAVIMVDGARTMDGSVQIDGASAVDGGGTEAGDASVPSTANLIVNGDAEASEGSPDGSPVGAPQGWTITGEATAVQYDATGGFPTSNDPGPADRGLNFFAGGYVADSTLTQTVSLASYSTKIDAGAVGFSLSAYLGGFSSQDDNAELRVSFRNASNTEIDAASVGPVTAADRSDISGLYLRSTTGTVPVGTRSVVVRLVMTRHVGSANDGYADNLSLTLSGV
jgi:hypothetical protein